MALEEYRRKRDFNKTPEPAPESVRLRPERLTYLIQKHDATRLHYDFRLELDGVLLSWAVTKGPSVNPGDKRLAVRTEDHPVSYGSFEGTIPKGQYGGGTVMLWDTGSWEPLDDPRAGLKKGHLSFVLHGERLKGKWDLVRMRGEGKRENWLLIKQKDAEASNSAGGKFLDDRAFSVTSGRSMDEIAGVDPPRADKAARPAKKVAAAAPKEKDAGKLKVSSVDISHPDRVISAEEQITKGELAEYYAGVARLMLPDIVRRPLSLLRCPSGIGGECFFQRNPGKGLGAHIRTYDFRRDGKKDQYLYIEDEQGLLELIQMGTIELHPWGATIDAIDYPDRMIFDLDPAPDVPFEAIKLAAQDLKRRLKSRGLISLLKCSGGKGLHVTVPLAAKDKWDAVKKFAEAVVQEMVDATPEAYVATASKAKRTGKIFIDYLRNDYTATAIADYGVRARRKMAVAVPLDWKELKTLKSADQFSMEDVLKRVKRQSAPDKEIGQTLPVGNVQKAGR